MADAILYQDFLKRKKHTTWSFGFDPVWMPESAFDFQAHIIDKAVRKGRIGLFEDTGLGKTMQSKRFTSENGLKQEALFSAEEDMDLEAA